ncbi:MAG: homocysteine S-methyltransferase family protein [bacterium]|nr:homocysteine S-methyltransferase family protein [bacterium]
MQSLTTRPILLDGALGTELECRGLDLPLPLWTAQAVEEHPDLVRAIHQSYIRAGAHVITAATFRTTRWTLSKVNRADEAEHLTKQAVELARSAVPNLGRASGAAGPGGVNSQARSTQLSEDAPAAMGPAPALVAGSLAPLEDCFHPELAPGDLVLQAEHRHNAQSLANAGVDIILVETHNSLREARIATHFARATGIPVWTSFILKSPTELLNGDSLEEAARTVVKFGAGAVLINCTPLHIAAQAVMNMSMHVPQGILLGVYPNAHDETLSPAEFAEWAIKVSAIADILGGCCGIGPEHLAALKSRLLS